MKRLRILGVICAVGAAVSGCIQSPTTPGLGGHTLGSGNLTGVNRGTSTQKGGYTIGSGNVTGPTVSSQTTASDTTSERSGHTVGSGN